MKVVFLQDVPNVAKAGDTKDVADGYARNFLLVRNLAVLARPGALQAVKAQIESRAETEKLKKLAGQLEGKEIVLKVKMGAKGRMHGSIGAADIAKEVKNAFEIEVDKRKIDLAEPIKQLGNYEVTVKLAKDITPKIKLSLIEKEKPAEEEQAAEEEKPVKKERRAAKEKATEEKPAEKKEEKPVEEPAAEKTEEKPAE
jgi:large subunit ribosomal protein L9